MRKAIVTLGTLVFTIGVIYLCFNYALNDIDRVFVGWLMQVVGFMTFIFGSLKD